MTGPAGPADRVVAADRVVHAVLPADVDDPTLVSGGNVYDRRVLDGLREQGREVREHLTAGAWPRPTPAERDGLARTLAALPDGAVVLADGLVASAAPEVLVPAAARLALAVLVHLPLGAEPATADLAAGEGEVLRAAAAVVATSPWAARLLRERDGLADVAVVTPGVDPAALAPGTDGVRRVVCVGALTATKGQDLLVAALPDGLECDLVGPRDRDPAFVAALARSGPVREGRVRMPGPRPREEAFRDADLVVVPSRTETYGMVVTEALARGIPVLVAEAGGLAETLDGAGMSVPCEDAPALGAALSRWRDEPDLREGLRLSAARARGRLSGWTETSRRLAAALPGTTHD